jgi:glycosyltransferase involved in cell wall biosynthesis
MSVKEKIILSRKKKIGILIVAYNHEKFLEPLLERIPKEIIKKIDEIAIFDDHSHDKTFQVAMDYKEKKKFDKLTIFYNNVNLGYGGNQKKGYLYFINNGFDIVVLLHGDGQYAPELLPSLLKPLEDEQADAVFGSRMIGRGALKGGMPLYKYVGNKLLTFCENRVLGMYLTEFHSGYRLYSCAALKKIPFEKCSDAFHFDTDIIIMFHDAGLKIVELPIPTYYGDEISYVNVLQYGCDVLQSILSYKLHKLGILHSEKFSRS